MGRWPNLDNGDGGYTTVSAQPASNRLTSGTALPAGNWIGGTIHLKVIRWSMVNRDITAQSGSTITLNKDVACPYTSNCTGWGFFINNSLNTLDREGEWYYDKATRKVYLYTTTNPNSSTIEGSVVLKTDDRNWGAINARRRSGRSGSRRGDRQLRDSRLVPQRHRLADQPASR